LTRHAFGAILTTAKEKGGSAMQLILVERKDNKARLQEIIDVLGAILLFPITATYSLLASPSKEAKGDELFWSCMLIIFCGDALAATTLAGTSSWWLLGIIPHAAAGLLCLGIWHGISQSVLLDREYGDEF
jgi:hypothetical protein